MLHKSESSNSCNRITKPCTYILNILHFLLYTETNNNLFIHVICVEVCNIITKEKTYYIILYIQVSHTQTIVLIQSQN